MVCGPCRSAGPVVVPGTTFVEVALHVGTELGCGVLEIWCSKSPLVLSAERGEIQLQVTLESPDESGGGHSEYSLAEGDSVGMKRTSAPGLVMLGVACSAPSTSSRVWSPWLRRRYRAPRDQALDAANSPLRCTGHPPAPSRLSVDDVYDYFAGVGLRIWPHFSLCTAAWRRGEEAFTEVRLPEDEPGRRPGVRYSSRSAGLRIASRRGADAW